MEKLVKDDLGNEFDTSTEDFMSQISSIRNAEVYMILTVSLLIFFTKKCIMKHTTCLTCLCMGLKVCFHHTQNATGIVLLIWKLYLFLLMQCHVKTLSVEIYLAVGQIAKDNTCHAKDQ